MSRTRQQRRAATRRERAGAGRTPGPGTRSPAGPSTLGHPGGTRDDLSAREAAERYVGAAVRGTIRHGRESSPDFARGLLAVMAPGVLPHAGPVLTTNLQQLLHRALGGGWSLEDLVELVRRQSGGQHLGALVASIERSPWAPGLSAAHHRALSEQLGVLRPPDLQTQDGIACALWLTALLAILPTSDALSPAPPPGAPPPAARQPRPEDRKLATVRALLAKAESTRHDDEAEALTAKAQELISRYALARLLEEETAQPRGRGDVALRRIWLDAPYVSAKASVVAAVAVANRCGAVAVDSLGFSAVLGDPRDLEAVELLATSLLVQADQAMFRHGRQTRFGRSTTRSFRHSFLLAYARRIGERLQEVDEAAVRTSGQADRLLPVLRDQDARVEAAVHEHFPSTTRRTSSASDAAGWAAGREAADRARLDLRGRLAPG